MKSKTVEPGEFIRPAGAQLRSARNEGAVIKVWEEVGECLAYPKSDGWRIQVHKIGTTVKLFSRKGIDYAKEYPSVVPMIRAQVEDELAILDTELVGFDQHGHHLEPAKLRSASQYRCYLLDALYLKRRDLTLLTVQERVDFIQEHLHDAFHDMLTFAEYTFIRSQDDLIKFYQGCQVRRKEGFDGAIIKKLNTPYFTDVLKLKAEDTIDAVVIGAYRDKEDVVQSLLLGVLSNERKHWVPVAKVTRTNIDWDTIWTACQSYSLDYRPPNLDEISDLPDIWIDPRVVVEVTMTELLSGKNYLVHTKYPRRCILREDKGPEEATSFEQVIQMASPAEEKKILKAIPKNRQLLLFNENASL